MLGLRNAPRRLFSSVSSTTPSTGLVQRPYFDFKSLIARAAYIESNALARAVKCDIHHVIALFREWTVAQGAVDALRTERNSLSKSGAGVDKTLLAIEGRALRERLLRLTEVASVARDLLDAAAAALPSDSHPSSPIGSEVAAVEIGRIGVPREFIDFVPQSHLTLGDRLGLFDWSGAAAAAGAGFASLSGDGVRLELAIVQWALARAAAAGFALRAPPDIARLAVLEGCGFSPRNGGGAASSQVYTLQDDGLALVGTSEVPLAALRAGTLLDTKEAEAGPSLFAGWGHCFRREAGGSGAATRGLYRLHQFTKVELFVFVAPTATPPQENQYIFPEIAAELSKPHSAVRVAALPQGGTMPCLASEAVFSRLVDFQASLIAELGLAARVLDMPTEELGSPAYRKVDIETWMPGREVAAGGVRGSWGEVSSASNCGDFQARRLGMRYRVSAKPGDVAFLHTLNATAAAIPRLLLTILETHQTRDGDVELPACLAPYLNGQRWLRVPPSRHNPTTITPFNGPAWGTMKSINENRI